jgi:hypothetical protein
VSSGQDPSWGHQKDFETNDRKIKFVRWAPRV